MKSINTRKIGKEQEEIACSFLEKKGFVVVEKNYHYSNKAEIDLIVYEPKKEILVFVEVKSGNYDFNKVIQKVNKLKQQQIIMAAESFLQGYAKNYNECRFDVIITDNSKNIVKKHIENAFNVNR